ncbi:MAG: alpha/beta hydrolase [Mucinivorans sp.]
MASKIDYTQRVLTFERDYDGPVVATLLRSVTTEKSKAVLYIHGYTDYFFQDHLAQEFINRGYCFYALDLRKYGRSLIKGQHPNFCRSMREYYPEITQSIEIMAQDGFHKIVLLGHSTGGLLAALYANDGPMKSHLSHLVLNSPFFEFNTTWCKRHIQIPLAGVFSLFLPFVHSAPELSRWYAQSIHKDFKGEWEFNRQWKPIEGFPLYFAWLRAISLAQKELRGGLNIKCHILVMSSDHSVAGKQWHEGFRNGDAVLRVNHIEKEASSLGRDVIYTQIKNGVHDLFLSAKDAREKAFEVMFNFLK